MPDLLFADTRLARIYDQVDGERTDLDAYLALVDRFGARSVLDIGCGTGTFACLLASRGLRVTGLDPAQASLAVARRKPGARRVRWVVGTVTALPRQVVDVVTMTGNVAQVFLSDAAWADVLKASHSAMAPGARLLFETRDPAARAWRGWTRAATERRIDLLGGGSLRTWQELIDVHLPLVSFHSTFVFEPEGAVLTSRSTLRFRDRAEVALSLAQSGFALEEVRDAPDRRGLELVFLACRTPAP